MTRGNHRSASIASWIAAASISVAPAGALQRSDPQAALEQSREPLCIFHGVRELGGNASEASRLAVRNACRQRYGWNQAETDQAILIGQILADVMIAQRDAERAGVPAASVGAVAIGLTAEQRRAVQMTEQPTSPETEAVMFLIFDRLVAQGVDREDVGIAARGVVLRILAARETGLFTRMRAERRRAN